ncbi:MAG: hypothetical protein BGO67_07910 [Alphaproteobacteria bacterium 41-28]|nr:MAG: hypothetical protein BGO67_07910 [Alphaproteobacteria bacterium 41-28]
MKTYLKSSVSVFVLLFTFSTFTPSLGMEERKEEMPDKKAAKKLGERDDQTSKSRLNLALADLESKNPRRVSGAEVYLKNILALNPEGNENSVDKALKRLKALGVLVGFYIRNNKEDDFRALLPLVNSEELEKFIPFTLQELPNSYYPFTVLILEEVNKRLEGDRTRFKPRVRLDTASCIVSAKDKERFTQAEAYLQEVLDNPPENDGDAFYSNHSTYLNSERPRALSTLFRLYVEMGDNEAINKLLSALNQTDLVNLITPSVFKNDYGRDSLPEALISAHYFLPALSILTEANGRLSLLGENHPLLLRIGLNITECILGIHDQGRFLEAESYIRKVIDPQGELSSTPGENTTCVMSNQNVARHLQAALQVARGQFEEASGYLKTLSEDNEFAWLKDTVLIALQGQANNPALSNEFIALVGATNFPNFFPSPEELKGELKKGRASLKVKEIILQYITSNKWFFEIAIKRGLLDSAVFEQGLHELSQQMSLDTSAMLSIL